MHTDEITQLMTPRHGSKKSPAMKSRLGPREIKPLSDAVEIWSVRILGSAPTSLTARALNFDGLCLFNGFRHIYVRWDEIEQKPGEWKTAGTTRTVYRGLKFSDFVATVYEKLKLHPGTRLLLLTFDTAENAGVFDLHDLDSRIAFNPVGVKMNLAYTDKSAGQRVEFVDVGAFFPDQSLGDVARAYGLNYEVDAPKRPRENDLDARAYLRQDVDAIWRIFGTLRAGLGRAWGIDPAVYRTPASCAARAYTGHYLKAAPGPVTRAIRTQAMRCYWGGRIEAFFRGQTTGDITVYDAVSLYPQSAINLKIMPRAGDWYRLTEKRLHTCAGGLCTVSFQFPADEFYPCLPAHAGGKTYYPLSGLSHCTVHEVRYALECGAKIQLLEGWGYDDGDETLAAYSRDLLAQKNAADRAGDYAGRTLAKLLMNALYGKFGQHHIGHSLETLREICRTYNYPDVSALLKTGNWEMEITQETGEIIEPEIQISDYWCPEWAALINGYARYIEARAMREYVALTGTIDSIIIPGDAGEELLIDGVRFKREMIGDTFVSVRARLYVLTRAGDVIKAALHGAPLVQGMAEKLAAWKGETELTVKAVRVRQIREGVTTGQTIGRAREKAQSVSMEWDNRRRLDQNFPTPWPEIPPKIDLDQVEANTIS